MVYSGGPVFGAPDQRDCRRPLGPWTPLRC
jgi:hypothetical protein